MPREHRKRGKKHKKKPDDETYVQELNTTSYTEAGEPLWIRPAPEDSPELNVDAPFGYVDADVKAYFRTVDDQIRGWQEADGDRRVIEEIADPNEERRLFFMAALKEMRGKEKQLATDPDCSVILERMAYSMDDFVRRVFLDSLSGSYGVLAKHRFASHVCQTFLTVAKETVSREARGIISTVPESSSEGELRTLTQLVLDISEELLPAINSLVLDPFASHIIRALLLLLSLSNESAVPALRSKKSVAWKTKQGPMRSVFLDDKGKGKEVATQQAPAAFRTLARRFVEVLRAELNENEVRALAANNVASPVLQLLLEIEADLDMSKYSDSLMDRVTIGTITACSNGTATILEPSDYLNILLRDPTSSHLLETVVSRSPDNGFVVLWSTYFQGKLARLALHPVANFVVAKALERVSADQLAAACGELEGNWSKMIKSSRTGVLRAIVDRAAGLRASEKEVGEAVFSAFSLVTEGDRKLLVSCVLPLLPMEEYKLAITADNVASAHTGFTKQPIRHQATNTAMEPKVQGAILLQSLLRLPEPHNQIVIASIVSLSIHERLKIAHNATASRVYDMLLESPTVSASVKRQFVMDFVGYYHLLVDDRIGSRIGDRCWSFADTYLKEKIGRSLFAHEQTLVASYYGKFFARNVNLSLLQRRPEDWRNMQADRKRTHGQSNHIAGAELPTIEGSEISPQYPVKRKRHARVDDDIDALFNASFGKKVKKAALGPELGSTPITSKSGQDQGMGMSESNQDLGLARVFGAIRTAPKDEKLHKSKRHR